MITLSFLLILTGMAVITTGILLATLYIAGSGKWPGWHPRRWERRLQQLALVSVCGLGLVAAGMLVAYGI